ncbi:MAG: PEGA domain-containing protein [Fibrobacter sp.]|nr:PEGA domain-containing protein [Fibrobacter sp.]
MNKLFLALLLIAFGILSAQDPQGVHARVELVTGAKQGATFLGISQDTVSLGGTIQGKFTVVRIHRSRFKSIVDDQGNDLLNPVAATDSSAIAATAEIDTSVSDSARISPADSIPENTAQAPADSAMQDSPARTAGTSDTATSRGTVPEEFRQTRTPTFLDSVDGKHIFVALERRSIDSALSEELNHIAIRILKEQGVPVMFARRTSFGYCREQACIRDSLLRYGATDLFQGTISAAKAQDSVSVFMTHTYLTDSSQQKSNSARMNLSSFTAMSDAIAGNKLNNFLKQLQGQSVAPADRKSYIHVETDPEGANLEIEGTETLCKTPCTVATLDTGKIVVYAYWSVDRHIWAARSAISAIPGDTNKVSLKLKQSKPELLITSTPEGAEIYGGSAPISRSTKSIGRTPSKFALFEPGLSTVQLRKEGFRDTMVTVYANPTGITSLEVQMEPISDPAEQLRQQEWLHEKKKNFVGKTLMGSAIAPILIGALFTYLAYDDYDEAEKIKDDLSLPATSNGANYQKLVKKNHDKVDQGDRKMIIGGSLIGSGLLLFGIGFTLAF